MWSGRLGVWEFILVVELMLCFRLFRYWLDVLVNEYRPGPQTYKCVESDIVQSSNNADVLMTVPTA